MRSTWGDLLNFTGERTQAFEDSRVVEIRDRGSGGFLAVAIVGVCAGSQADVRQVALGRTGEKLDQLGGFSQAQGQQTGGHGIQGSGVPDLERRRPGLDLLDHIEGGAALGLVDQQYTVGSGGGGTLHPFKVASTA